MSLSTKLSLSKLEAEIARLQEENAHLTWRDQDKNKLITELALELEICAAGAQGAIVLIQRAREAVKPSSE